MRRHLHSVDQQRKPDSLDALDPFFLLLCGRSGDSVKGVVALDDAAVGLRLTGFDHLIFVVGDEELKAVLRKDKNEGVKPENNQSKSMTFLLKHLMVTQAEYLLPVH